MPLGATTLLRALAACDEAERSGRWNQLAVLGLYCKLFMEKYSHHYDPKEHGWEWAQKKIALLFQNAHSADLAAWCVYALFHPHMNWFKTKSLDKLANRSTFDHIQSHALWLRQARQELAALWERERKGSLTRKDIRRQAELKRDLQLDDDSYE